MKLVKRKAKRPASAFLIILVAVIWVLLAVINFINTMGKIQNSATTNELETIAECNAAETRAVFERYTKTLAVAANLIERLDDMTSPKALVILQELTAQDDFVGLSIEFSSGMTWGENGWIKKEEHIGYREKIEKGLPFVSDVSDQTAGGQPLVSVFVPIKDNTGNAKAALRGDLSTAQLTDVFEKTFAKSGGYYHVVDGNGRYVSPGASQEALLMDENYFDAIGKLTYHKGITADQLKQALRDKQRGSLQYLFQGHERYAYYAPVGINDWNILMIMPRHIVEETANRHTANAMWLMVQVVLVLLFFVYYAYFSQKRERDVALLNEKCFRLLAEQTNKAIFEWDYESSDVRYLSDFARLFGNFTRTYNSVEQVLAEKIIHQSDLEAVGLLHEAVSQAKSVSNIKLRIADQDGCYHWCEISLAVVKKQNGKPYKAVGFLENVDEKVKAEELLRKKSETDQLTGIYNKVTTEYLIRETLSDPTSAQNKHALMIIDIDNYKDVNDRLGHLYGDIVLAQLSGSLQTIIGTEDILGRLGGDEFFVLVKNYPSIDRLHQKAEQVCEALRKTYYEGDASASISASIGISLFPEQGTAFEQLYKAADIALYHVKAGGKDGYRIYSGEKMQHYTSNRTVIDEGGPHKSFHRNKLEYLFKLLYDMEDTNFAVTSGLRLVSEQFGLSRGTIFQIDEGGTTTSCNFEWCADRVESVRQRQQRIPLDSCDFFFEEFERSGGIFVASIDQISEPVRSFYRTLKVGSLVNFAIVDGKKTVGTIGFQDEGDGATRLTPQELNEMKTMCQVLSTFILKQRSIDTTENKKGELA